MSVHDQQVGVMADVLDKDEISRAVTVMREKRAQARPRGVRLMTVAEATRENFHELVAEGTVLVDVWGPRCRECLALMPHVERIAAARDLTLVKLEAPKARSVCIELGVMSMPTLLLLRDGKEQSRVAGQDLTVARIEEWLDASAS